MNTPSNPPTSNRPPFADPLAGPRDNLRRAAEHRGIDIEELEHAVGTYVSELKAQGVSPEAVLVAIKKLLLEAEPPPANGTAWSKALRSARDSHNLHDAIVTLAIALYFGIPSLQPGLHAR